MLEEGLLRRIQDEYENTLLPTRLKKDDFLRLQRTMVAQKNDAPPSPPTATKPNGVETSTVNGAKHDPAPGQPRPAVDVDRDKDKGTRAPATKPRKEESDDEDEGIVFDLNVDGNDSDEEAGILFTDMGEADEGEEEEDDDLMLYARPSRPSGRGPRGGGKGRRRGSNPYIVFDAEEDGSGGSEDDEDDDEEESQYDTDDDEEEESDYDSDEEDDDFEPRHNEEGEEEDDDDDGKGEEGDLDDEEIEHEQQKVVYRAKGKEGSRFAKLFKKSNSEIGLVVGGDDEPDDDDDVFIANDDEGAPGEDECEEAEEGEDDARGPNIPGEREFEALCDGRFGRRERERLSSMFGCYFRIVMTNAMCKRSLDRMRERAMGVPPAERANSDDWRWHAFFLAVEKKAAQLTGALEEAHGDASDMRALFMRLRKSMSVVVTEHRPKRPEGRDRNGRRGRAIVEEDEGGDEGGEGSSASATVTCSLTRNSLSADDAAKVVLTYDERKMGLPDDAKMGGDKSPNSVFVCSPEHAVLCSSFFFLHNLRDMCTATFARWFDTNSRHITRKDSIEEVCTHMHKTQFSNQHPIPKIGSRFVDAVSYVRAYLDRHDQMHRPVQQG